MTVDHRIVTREEWLAARRQLLTEEKVFTRQRDELSARRRALPWVRIDEPYAFTDAVSGRSGLTLADLFDGRRQLLVYHFMLGPGWDEGCPSCSFWADGYDGVGVHLAARHTTLAAVSRGPAEAIAAYRQRMGWSFPWYSSAGSRFNLDFGVSFPADHPDPDATYNYDPAIDPGEEGPGISAFIRGDDGVVYHTYSTYARGLDPYNPAYQLLDATALGRHEDDLPWPMAWLRRHDRYGDDSADTADA